MSDMHAGEGGFDFRRGISERTVISNVDETLNSLLPETIKSNPTVRWLRSLEVRQRDFRPSQDEAHSRDAWTAIMPLGNVFLAQSILIPVIQARLDFLMQSLYPAARVINVSERAIELIAESRKPEHLATTLGFLSDNRRSTADQNVDIARLRDAAEESLADLLTSTADLHRRRRAAALRAFEDWLAEADAFRSSFEPAYAAFGQVLRSRRYDRRLRSKNRSYEVDLDFIRALAPLIAYLSRNPRLSSAGSAENLITMNRQPLTLSPGEITGLLAVLQGFTGTDGSVHPRDYEMATRELSSAFLELSQEPLVQAELAALQHRISNFNPFPEQLVGPPSESLWVAIQEHVLPNRVWSPWLRQFLTQFGAEPRWWVDTIRFGSAADPEYVQALASSAHSAIVRQFTSSAPYIAEPWDEFLERLFTEKWLMPLRWALSRSSDSPWTRESFVAVMAAVRERLHRDGYRLSIDDQALGGIWDSAL